MNGPLPEDVEPGDTVHMVSKKLQISSHPPRQGWTLWTQVTHDPVSNPKKLTGCPCSVWVALFPWDVLMPYLGSGDICSDPLKESHTMKD